MRRLFSGPLWVHYGQANIMPLTSLPEDWSDAFKGQVNGIFGAAQQPILSISTGLHTGTVDLVVDEAVTEPPIEDCWEDIVEVSFLVDEPVHLVEWAAEASYPIDLKRGIYRVRYHATGMDAGHDMDTSPESGEIVDSYKLVFWPSQSMDPDKVLQQGSDCARWRHEWAASIPE
jgi:hypothetical protein